MNILSFKNTEKPLITVMIQARTKERMLNLISDGIKKGADAFGLQIEQLEPKYRTKETYTDIFNLIGNKPTYITNYNTQLNENYSDEQCIKELLYLSEFGGTLFDVPGDIFSHNELQLTDNDEAIKKQISLINQFHNMNKEVLMSSHTYKYIDLNTALYIAKSHQKRGADVSKIVAAANTENELLDSYIISSELKKQIEIPNIFLCGGKYSRPQRMINPIIGSALFLCVTEYDDLATTAQPLIDDAKKIISLSLNNF